MSILWTVALPRTTTTTTVHVFVFLTYQHDSFQHNFFSLQKYVVLGLSYNKSSCGGKCVLWEKNVHLEKITCLATTRIVLLFSYPWSNSWLAQWEKHSRSPRQDFTSRLQTSFGQKHGPVCAWVSVKMQCVGLPCSVNRSAKRGQGAITEPPGLSLCPADKRIIYKKEGRRREKKNPHTHHACAPVPHTHHARVPVLTND